MSHWSAPERRRELYDALRDAAEAPLEIVFIGRNTPGRKKYAVLAEAAEELVKREWARRNYNGALTVVINQAVEALANNEGPEPRYSGLSWREIGQILYGFEQTGVAEEMPGTNTYDERLQRLIDRSPPGRPGSKATRERRITTPFFEKLADEFASLKPSATVSKELAEQGEAPIHVVYREEYVNAIRSIVDNGRMVVCIWGEAGTGKTVLATQVAHALQCGPAFMLRPSDSRVLHGDLVAALLASGEQCESWNGAACLNAFRGLLANAPDNGIAIIDDVSSEAVLESIIPPNPKMPVIVTSRVRLKTPVHECIEVHDFSDAQALSFLREGLAEQDEQRVRALASLLGNRPLALSHAVSFLREVPDVASQDLINDLLKSVNETVNAIAPQVDTRNLTALYRSVLASVGRNEKVATTLDTLLAIAGITGYVPRELHYAFLRLRFGNLIGSRLYFRTSLRVLERLGLVRDEAEMPLAVAQAVQQRPWLLMHPLTCQLLRELRWARVIQLENDLIRFLIDEHDRSSGQRPDDLTEGMKWVALYGRELTVAENILPGWRYLLCVDPETWVAVRRDLSGNTEPYVVRYEISRGGVYRLDYLTGNRAHLEAEEAGHLYQAIKLYVKKARAAYGVPIEE